MPEITEFMLGTTAQYKFDAKYREWISLIHAATSCNIFSLVASVIPESFEDDRVNGSTGIRFYCFRSYLLPVFPWAFSVEQLFPGRMGCLVSPSAFLLLTTLFGCISVISLMEMGFSSCQKKWELMSFSYRSSNSRSTMCCEALEQGRTTIQSQVNS